jgi:hypothetical protein
MTGKTLIEHIFSGLAPKTDMPGRTRGVEIGQRDVIQASKREAGIMRYELSDDEWPTIGPMLPNKARGVPRVDDRRILNGIFWVLRSAGF